MKKTNECVCLYNIVSAFPCDNLSVSVNLLTTSKIFTVIEGLGI